MANDEKGAKNIRIFHTGKGHGPMQTEGGSLIPGGFVDVSEALAKKLTGAYKHIKLAKDVIPGGAVDPRVAAENKELKAKIEELEKQLEDGAEGAKEAAEAAKNQLAELEGQVKDLSDKLAAAKKKGDK